MRELEQHYCSSFFLLKILLKGNVGRKRTRENLVLCPRLINFSERVVMFVYRCAGQQENSLSRRCFSTCESHRRDLCGIIFLDGTFSKNFWDPSSGRAKLFSLRKVPVWGHERMREHGTRRKNSALFLPLWKLTTFFMGTSSWPAALLLFSFSGGDICTRLAV